MWYSVRASVRTSMRAEKLQFESFNYLDSSDLSWISFYDYFRRLKYNIPLFHRFVNRFRSGFPWMWLAFENLAIVSEPPTSIYAELNQRLSTPSKRYLKYQLHSITAPAIEFGDGYRLYYIHGLKFEEDLWKQFFPIRETIDPATILAIPNAEQRAAVIQCYGIETILDSLPEKRVIEKQRDGHHFGELIEFRYDNWMVRAVVLPDHATPRRYVILVPNECDTYAHAKLWHNGFDKKEWNQYEYLVEA